MSKNIFYVGSFENGFHICSLDTESEKLEYIRCIEHLKPAHIITSKDRKKIFITSEMFGEPGQVASYDISNPIEPKLISAVRCVSQGPCYIQLSDDERFLIGGSYFEGNLEVYPVQNDGKIGDRCFEYQSMATGTAYASGSFGQAVPRIHCVSVVKDTNYVLATDYSGDRIVNFEIDENGALCEKAELFFPKGDAPRQIAFSPMRKDLFYMVTEFSSKVYAVKLDTATGEMAILDSISTLPEEKGSLSASIRVSPDGEFLYVSNRKDKNISVLSLHDNYEKLRYVGAIQDAGYIRDAVPEASGKYLLAAVEDENLIRLYIRNQGNGMCAVKPSKLQAQSPVCFAFV